MRIAFIGGRGYPYVYSGYETFIGELAERLAEDGHEITVYCHRNLFRRRPRIVGGIHLVYLPTIPGKFFSQFIHSFQAVAHACLRRYSAVLVVNVANGPFGVLTRLSGQKAAIHVDGLEWRRPKWKGLGGKYFHWAARAACRFFKVIITDSLEMQKVYEREFGRRPEMIAYGAPVRRDVKAEPLRRWGLSDRAYYLIVGRLVPDNNAGLIVREFLETDSSRRLVIVGDVPYRDAYARGLKRLNDPRLVFTGYVRDRESLASLYAHCYAYLHGHEFGGTNPSLLEALGAGAAVCALDTVFNREVLADGTYGLLFSKSDGDLRKLIRAIEDRPEDLEALRHVGPRRVSERYSWDAIAGLYENLFEGMVKSP